MNENPRWANPVEAGAYAACTERTIRNFIARGMIPAYRLGTRSIRVDLNDVDAVLKRIPTVDGDLDGAA